VVSSGVEPPGFVRSQCVDSYLVHNMFDSLISYLIFRWLITCYVIQSQSTGYDSADDRVQHLLTIVVDVQETTPARTATHTPQSKAKRHVPVLKNAGSPALHCCDVRWRARGGGGRR
jgi:hypothetical protein